MARRRSTAEITTGEILVWLLFLVLLLPAGITGWAIGHYTGHHTHTVTVSAAARPATTAQASTPQATTQQASTPQATTQQTSTAASTPQTTTAAAAPAGGSAAGKTVFVSSGCGACHTYKPAGSSATVGPDLDTKLSADAKKAKLALDAFTRESIVNPNAYVSPGYPKGVMPTTFEKQLTKAQLADLVSFVAGK